MYQKEKTVSIYVDYFKYKKWRMYFFFNEVGLNRDARKKPTNETTKRLLMLLCFFFPRMLFLCLKTD